MNERDIIPMLLSGKNGLQMSPMKILHMLFKKTSAKARLHQMGAIFGALYFLFSTDGKVYLMNDNAIEVHINEGAKCISSTNLNILLQFKGRHLAMVYRKTLDNMDDCKIINIERNT